MLRRLAVPCLLLAAACSTPSIGWTDPSAVVGAAGPARVSFDSAGQTRVVPDTASPAATPVAPGLCLSSLRTVWAARHLYAVWWSVRPDSSAVLFSASSPDSGKTWGAPAAVDTADVSSRGCGRPAPAVAAWGDDLHVAYSMAASEGTGVFFAHFMDGMLHSPVPVIYGERLVATAIAVEGDRVAVAYEEPNGSRQQVDVAISVTQGHIFERHTTASRAIDAASSPAVALAGPRIAVSWVTRRAADSVGTRIVRVGRIE